MRTFCLLAVALCVSTALGQAEPRGIPESARKEIIRRGYVAQVVSDEISDDGTERLCAAAGETPKLDNDKFNLTVLYGKTKNDQLDLLKKHLLEADPDSLGAWVECKNRGQGTYDVYSTDGSHLHVRFEQVPSPGDPDKWKGHEKFPTVILQTPYSGRFGKPGLTIDFFVGYNGKQQQLTDWIAGSIERFAKSRAAAPTREWAELLEKKIGHNSFEPGGHADIGGAAPFYVTPKTLPVGQNVPSPFPPNFAPVEPKGLTLAEIQAAAPGAPADFVLSQLSAGVKTAGEVAAAWSMAKQLADMEKMKADLAKQLEDAKKPAVPTLQDVVPSDEPAHPVADWLTRLLAGSGVLLLLVKVAIDLFRPYAAASPSQLDDLGLKVADSIVNALERKQVPSPVPSPAR